MTWAVHPPSTGSAVTEGIGWSSGSFTSTFTVSVASVSFGTTSAIVVVEPWAVSAGSISTWADAGAAKATSPMAPAATAVTSLRVFIALLLWLWSWVHGHLD